MLKIKNIPKNKIILAFSGGVDSVVLLYLLLKENIKNIVLVHVNHNLRGKESDGDEEFVRKVAKEKNLELFVKKLKKAPNNEEEGRKERYQFFQEIREKTKSKYIALAQHKSDQIETLLLQLIRGTHSFSPMKEFSEDWKWRPLLNYSKEEIYEYAKKNKLEWREDLSNKENNYNRNKIRNIVIPEILKINSNFPEAFLKFVEATDENSEYIKKESQIFLVKDVIERKEFLKLENPIQKAVVKFLNPKLYSKNIVEVIEMIEKGDGGKQKHGFTLEKGKITITNDE